MPGSGAGNPAASTTKRAIPAIWRMRSISISHLAASSTDALAAVIRRHPQVERIVCGHMHRSIEARIGRVTGVPLEPRAAVAQWNPASGQITVWVTSQNPHIHRLILSIVLGVLTWLVLNLARTFAGSTVAAAA